MRGQHPHLHCLAAVGCTTRLLSLAPPSRHPRDALHGWGQVVLSVNVSPVAKDYDETAHVLKVRAQTGERARVCGGGGVGWAPGSTCACPCHPQYAALATQIGTIQQAEAPRRTIKAVSPAIRKPKRKAALPPEARGQGARK